MKNPNVDQQSVPNDDYCESDDLLNSLTYGVRQFVISENLEDLVVGVLLEETVDSFLVAMPIRFSLDHGQRLPSAVVSGNTAFMRFLKTAVRIVAFPTAQQEAMYINYLIEKSPMIFPELLNIIGVTVLAGQANDEDIPVDGSDEVSPEIAHDQKSASSKDLDGGVLVTNPNLSVSEFNEKIKKAFAEGRVFRFGDKAKH